MKRIKYQKNAVKSLTDDVLLSLTAGDRGQEVALAAVTGSGKTYMASNMIENVFKQYKTGLSFVWLSIGKGDLHKQSKNAIESYIDTNIGCYYLEEYIDSGNTFIDDNTVIFANWESLRWRNQDTGEWRNKYMREGDHANFVDIVNNSKTQLAMVIDESHVAADTDRAMEIRQVLNPHVIIEMSATHKKDFSTKSLFGQEVLLTEVPLQDVIDAEMIVKDVEVNAGIGKYEGTGENSLVVVLNAEREHMFLLKQLYKAERSKVLPLTGIMIPNAKAGDSKMERILSFYETQGLTEENGRLAVYLSEHKSNSFSTINEPDSMVEVVIFKQGLDTGWDCPRAQTLVQFRNVKSEIFSAQTIGRFYRMPEHKHYRNDALNKAYIFTDIAANCLKVKHDSYSRNMVKDKVAFLNEDFDMYSLPSVYRRRVDQGTVGKNVYNTLEHVFCNGLNVHGVFFVENVKKFEENDLIFYVDEYKESIVKDIKVDIASVGERESLTGYVSGDKSASFYLSDADRDIAFEEVIWGNINGHFKNREKSVSSVKEAIYKYFKVYFNVRYGYQGNIIVQSIVLHPENIDKFSSLIYKTIELYAPKRQREVDGRVKFDQFDWLPPRIDRFSDNYELVEVSKYIYDKCYLRRDRSTAERKFEKFLEKNDKVSWWYKNGDGGRSYFGVRYRKSDNYDSTFYVDYVVRFSDGRVGLFDPKEGQFAETAGNKSNALQRYIEASERNIFGGVVTPLHDKWRINTNKEYNYNISNMNSWEYLEEVI